MTELLFSFEEASHIAENDVDEDYIRIMLNGLRFRSNISFKSALKKLRYAYMIEFICMECQRNVENFTEHCKDGDLQYECKVKPILSEMRMWF